MKFLFIFCALIISHSVFAQDKDGHWEGDGTCYYQHRIGKSSLCHFALDFDLAQDSLQIVTCTTWKVEWGDGHDCSKAVYTVKGTGLWLGDDLVGRISPSLIEIDYNQHNFITKKTYRWEKDFLDYRVYQATEGTEWLLRANLIKAN